MQHLSGVTTKGLNAKDVHFFELLACEREIGLDILGQLLPFGVITDRDLGQ